MKVLGSVMNDHDWNELDRVMSRLIGRRFQRTGIRTERKRNSLDLSPSEWMKSQFIPQTANESVKSAPPPLMDFTATEWEQVETAYRIGLEEEQWIKGEAIPTAILDIQRFLKLWNEMSPIAQACLVGEDDSADIYEGKIDRYRIEGRARTALRSLTTTKGRPAALANIRAAEVLAGLWRARGNEPKPGRLYSDKKSGGSFGSDYSPNAFVTFVARALLHLDPSLKTNDMAARRAKSAVDALHKDGQL